MAKVTYLTKEETEAFFRSIPLEQRRDRLLFDLIYRHGLRRQEAALLRTESVKDGRIWIYRLKGCRLACYFTRGLAHTFTRSEGPQTGRNARN